MPREHMIEIDPSQPLVEEQRNGHNRWHEAIEAAAEVDPGDTVVYMIDYLGTRGFDRRQAYALCSCAVDLRVSQTVDVPNLIVTALLPLDIFM